MKLHPELHLELFLKLHQELFLKLLGNTKKKLPEMNIVKILKTTEVVLVHCNIVNNDYQHDSRVLYVFASNKSFCQLLDISPKSHKRTLNRSFYILNISLLVNFLHCGSDRT